MRIPSGQFGQTSGQIVAVLLLALAPACSAQVGTPTTRDGVTETKTDPLLVAPNTWANKAIKVCFRPTQAEASGWQPPLTNCPNTASGSQYSQTTANRQAVEDAFNSQWGSVSKARLVGWGLCSQADECNPNVIAIALQDSGCWGLSQIGYNASQTYAAWSTQGLVGCSADQIQAIATHELGHVLGFEHEDARPDAPSGLDYCASSNYQSGNGTAVGSYDGQSIMEFGYCQTDNYGLTATDTLGVRQFYGPRGEDTILATLADGTLDEKHYSGSWTSWAQMSGLGTDLPQAVTITKDGAKAAFAVSSSDNKVYTDTYRNGSWHGWYNLGGLAISGPAAVATERQDGNATKLYLTVFVRLSDGTISYKYYDPAIGNWTSAWTAMPAPPSGVTFLGSPAATISDSRQTVVFTLGSDGNIYHTWSDWTADLGSWHSWVEVPALGGGGFSSAPAAVTTADGRLTVLAVKWADGQLYHAYYDPFAAAWYPWSSLGGSCSPDMKPAAGVSPGGRLVLYCRWTDGTLYSRYNDSGTWYQWAQLDSTQLATGPAAME